MSLLRRRPAPRHMSSHRLFRPRSRTTRRRSLAALGRRGSARLPSHPPNGPRKRPRYRRGVMRALAVALLALAAAAAAGAATSPAQQSLATAAPVKLLAADGMRAAAVVPGDGRSRCTRIVLWRPGTRPVTIET